MIDGSASSVATSTSASAASAEETAAASAELSSMAGTLASLVNRFRLASETEPAATVRPEPEALASIGRGKPVSKSTRVTRGCAGRAAVATDDDDALTGW